MDESEIVKRFAYHTPKEGHGVIRQKAYDLARLFNAECPEGREKALALTKLEEAVMWANAAIARNEE